MYFVRKHVETGPSSSYELAIFLNYYMPLSKLNFLFHNKIDLGFSIKLQKLNLNVCKGYKN